MPGFGLIGTMDTFGTPHAMAAATMLPEGGVVVAGGGALDGSTADDGVYRLEFPDTSALRLDRVTDLPGPRAGAAATTVTIDGINRVLISGGRTVASDRGTNAALAMIFDPISNTIGWREPMSVARSEHVAVHLENGRVLLAGGWIGGGDAPDRATFEFFDSNSRSLLAGGSLDVPSVGLAAASLGPDGVLVCGGGVLNGTVLEPSAACNRVSLTGQVTQAADMPGPRMGHALSLIHI